MTLFRTLSVLFLCGISTLVYGENTNVAVAANFSTPMQEIVALFEKQYGHHVTLSVGSSGLIYAQIKNGAPYHVFFSADQSKPVALEKDQQVVPGSRFTYAIGALALWSSETDYIDEQALILKHAKFNKLALANPKLSPYGVAAHEVLRNLQLQESSKGKLVQGENIAQVFQFVASGNADLGLVALSQIMSQGQIRDGSTWMIPTNLYSPIYQDAVLLKKGSKNIAALALMQFVRGPKAAAIMQAYGYQTLEDRLQLGE